jgi:hypothetical protein
MVGKLGRVAAAFLIGALAVLIVHQPTLALLHAAGLTPVAPYPMRPTSPLATPLVLSLAFWGGVWSIPIAWLLTRVPADWRYWAGAALLGAFPPTLTSWFIIFPLKGLPFGGGPASVGNAQCPGGEWRMGTGSRSSVPACTGRSSPRHACEPAR